MHDAYWDLGESPFRTTKSKKYFFASPTHEEALARMHFLVEQRRSLAVLTGCVGCGKSLAMQIFASELSPACYRVCQTNVTGLGDRALLWTIAADLNTNPATDAEAFHLWRLIEDGINETALQDQVTILLLDDVDHATDDALLQIRRIAKVLAGKVIMVLSAESIHCEQLEELAKLIDLQIQIEPWTEADTADFLQTSLSKAGNKSTIFDDSALSRIHELSGGVPREVCHLAELALIAGAGQQLDIIDWNTIEAVYLELTRSQPKGIAEFIGS